MSRIAVKAICGGDAHSSAPEARSVGGAGSGGKDEALRRVEKRPAVPRQGADQ